MTHCPMKWIATWRARSKRMNAITPLAIRGKHDKAGQNRWDAARPVSANSVSPAVGMIIKTDRR